MLQVNKRNAECFENFKLQQKVIQQLLPKKWFPNILEDLIEKISVYKQIIENKKTDFDICRQKTKLKHQLLKKFIKCPAIETFI